jgi:hypothetical protein
MPAHAASMPTAYPLSWPPEYRRTAPEDRAAWQGKGVTFGGARDALLSELERSGCKAPVLSTNIETYRRGGIDIPYANQPAPVDPGVAVYFTLADELHCYACDAYETVKGNMKSLALDLRDLRRIQKRGSLKFMERAMQGFRALPEEATDGAGAWWQVLGLEQDATEEEVARRYRQLAHERHPDKAGGSRAAWERLQRAKREAQRAIEHRADEV